MVKLTASNLLFNVLSWFLLAQCIKFNTENILHPEVLDAMPSDFGASTDVEERELLPPVPHIIENPEIVETPKHFEKKAHHLVAPHPPAAVPFSPQTLQPQTLQPQAVQPQAVQPQAVQPQAVQPQALQPSAGVSGAALGEIQQTVQTGATPEQEATIEEQEAVIEDIQSAPSITVKIIKSPWQEPSFAPNKPEAIDTHHNELAMKEDLQWEEINTLLEPVGKKKLYIKFENVHLV